MKSVELNDIDKLPGKRVEKGETFQFRCHDGLSCFNLCCRNLNLFLTPYDVIQLKNCLGITSGEFLEKHTHVVMRHHAHFPDVLLKMAENDEKTCPFLTEKGCSVYPMRPDSCRTFPVEEGVIFEGDKREKIYLFRPPDFCMGKTEDVEWTIESWETDQDAVTYHKMTALWAEVKHLFHSDPWGVEGPEGRKAQMAFMATYNMDDFRTFVFESSFLKRFKIKSDVRMKAKKEDIALMKLGFEWVRFFLFNEKVRNIAIKK